MNNKNGIKLSDVITLTVDGVAIPVKIKKDNVTHTKVTYSVGDKVIHVSKIKF